MFRTETIPCLVSRNSAERQSSNTPPDPSLSPAKLAKYKDSQGEGHVGRGSLLLLGWYYFEDSYMDSTKISAAKLTR
jgi:hypothetical protein